MNNKQAQPNEQLATKLHEAIEVALRISGMFLDVKAKVPRPKTYFY
jgi:hypothetical protein